MRWSDYTLADAADILAGNAFSSAGYKSAASEYRLLRGITVAPRRLDWSDPLFWERTPGDGLDKFELRDGDIVVAMDRPWITEGFRVAQVSAEDTPSLLVQRVARLRPRLGFSGRFLYHLMHSGRLLQHLERCGTETTVPHVSHKDIAQFPFSAPPFAEQKRIAAILDKADAIKRTRQEAIRLTEELLRAAFLEMFGDPVTNPKGWEVKRLEELIDSERGISYGVVQRGSEVPGGVPVTRISNFVDNVFDCTTVVRTARNIANQYKRTFLRGGELVVSIRGTCGRVAVVPPEAAGWNVSREVAVVPLMDEVNAHFVRRVALSPGGQDFILGNVRGIAQRGINLADLRNLPIPMPPRSEMQKFDKLRVLHDSYSSRVAESHAAQESLAEALTQHAFSGRL